MADSKFEWAGTQEEMVSHLQSLVARLEAGEEVRAAFRVYKNDGTFEDIVIAPDQTEEDQLRAELQDHFRNRH